jgi:hypothetical protein
VEHLQEQVNSSLTPQSFWLPWGLMVLLAALLGRLLWVSLFQGEIGGDAIRYLWIAEHVRRGEWHLLPQLFSSPLLPVSIGILSRLTGDPVLAAKWIGVIMNTLAVGLAMEIFRQLIPSRPMLAWITGLGLALNHVWCRLAPFALTENLFYPLLMGYFLVLLHLRRNPTWLRGFLLGILWGALYLSREIGLFIGVFGFLAWLLDFGWRNRRRSGKDFSITLARAALPLFSILSVILFCWMYWFQASLGIFSLGEGARFYPTYTTTFDRQSESTYPGYRNGESAFFRLHPYEFMEYTRFPKPGDPRYPKVTALKMLAHPVTLAALAWDNLKWSLKEFQRVSLMGFIMLFICLPWLWWRGRIPISVEILWFYGLNWSILGLTFLGPLREARLIGWFFPWLYVSLGAGITWAWTESGQWFTDRKKQDAVKFCLAGIFLFTFLYPQYFKEVPHRWQVRREPHVHKLVADYIVANFGKNAVISSVEAEVAYLAGAYWICQPNTDAKHIIEWLYLGRADFLVINDRHGIGAGREIFWSDPGKIEQAFPELKLVASFNGVKNYTYGHKARLFRFTPDAKKFLEFQKTYSWAGTHPCETGAIPADIN